MNLVQVTPGAGGMYCGNCFRDNALVGALRKQGHQALLVPLYLPMTLDEPDQSAGTPVFFGGISVYLEQQSAIFRSMPEIARRWLSHPVLLKWASGRAAKTRAADVGALTVSMLKGEEGYQSGELETLASWLKSQPKPDAISLSNAMLAGLARRLRAELDAPMICMLQGEDAFLDGLPEPHRSQAWLTLSERVREMELVVAPSRYFALRMAGRLGLDPAQIKILPNGIRLNDFPRANPLQEPPVLGFFARMCPDKGLESLVQAFVQLKSRPAFSGLRLRIGGGCGPSDEAYVAKIKADLEARGFLGSVEFFPNLDRAAKLKFFESLSVFSVPARYGEAFGLYLVESWAAGVPVVQPREASFTELIEASGGGLLYDAGDASALAESLAELLADRARAARLGAAGRVYAEAYLTDDAMARGLAALVDEASSSHRSRRAGAISGATIDHAL